MRLFLVGLRLALRIGYCFFDWIALCEVLGRDGRVEFEEVVIVIGMDVGGAVGWLFGVDDIPLLKTILLF